MIAFYKQFNQGIAVAVCALSSFLTIGYMTTDNYKMETRQLTREYEEKLKVLKDENKRLMLKISEIK